MDAWLLESRRFFNDGCYRKQHNQRGFFSPNKMKSQSSETSASEIQRDDAKKVSLKPQLHR